MLKSERHVRFRVASWSAMLIMKDVTVIKSNGSTSEDFSEFGGTEGRNRLEEKLYVFHKTLFLRQIHSGPFFLVFGVSLRKIDLRMSILIVIYILNYVR